jgi:hypothetical protein
MSKILFITGPLRQEELGVMYLSAALRGDGHETMLAQMEIDDVPEAFERFAPDIAAWPVLTGTHTKSLELNRKLKKRFRFVSVFGGPRDVLPRQYQRTRR